MDWRKQISDGVENFYHVAHLAGHSLSDHAMEIEFLPTPHRPPTRLPAGKMAVYCFHGLGEWLKIGVAGPKSNARYTSQHNNPNSAASTPAASLMRDDAFDHQTKFGELSPGGWIKANTSRANILIDAKEPKRLLLLLEAFLHLKCDPRFER